MLESHSLLLLCGCVRRLSWLHIRPGSMLREASSRCTNVLRVTSPFFSFLEYLLDEFGAQVCRSALVSRRRGNTSMSQSKRRILNSRVALVPPRKVHSVSLDCAYTKTIHYHYSVARNFSFTLPSCVAPMA